MSAYAPAGWADREFDMIPATAVGRWGSEHGYKPPPDDVWADLAQLGVDLMRSGQRCRIAIGNRVDLFDPGPRSDHPLWTVNRDTLTRLEALIFTSPGIDWLVVTAFPQHFPQVFPRLLRTARPPNLWLGVRGSHYEQIVSRWMAAKRLTVAHRFLLIEPMASLIPLQHPMFGLFPGDQAEIDGRSVRLYDPDVEPVSTTRVEWVIAGGGLGPAARPMNPGWVRVACDYCTLSRTPFFFTRWGEWGEAPWDDEGELPIPTGPDAPESRVFWGLSDHRDPLLAETMLRVGAERAGRLLDGHEWNEVPASLTTPRAPQPNWM